MIEPKTVVFMGVSGSSKTTIGWAGLSWPPYWGKQDCWCLCCRVYGFNV